MAWPYNESIAANQYQEGTYLVTVRETGRNRELTTVSSIADRRVSCQLASNDTPERPMARGPCARECKNMSMVT